jgi:hypothetical protein
MQLAASIPITEAELGTLVDSFYTKVRDNATIGPIFNAEVEDWPTHLAHDAAATARALPRLAGAVSRDGARGVAACWR